jgi:hypothetical protein
MCRSHAGLEAGGDIAQDEAHRHRRQGKEGTPFSFAPFLSLFPFVFR